MVRVVTDPGSAMADRLTEHLRAGVPLDLLPRCPADDRPAPSTAPRELLDEDEMRAWDASHDVDADLLRDLLRGRNITDPDPRGLRLRGARIRGRLDLDRLDTSIVLELEDCLLDQGLTADWARLPALLLHRCRLSHPERPALSGGSLRVETSVSLAGSVFCADTADGTVLLPGAHILGQLFCPGAVLVNSAGPALLADGLQTGRNVALGGGFTAEGAGELGTIRLPGAHIGGQLRCSGATLRNLTGPALFADGLQADGGIFLDEGFHAIGAVRLLGARIGHRLSCSGATLLNPDGPALDAARMQTDGDVLLHDLSAIGNGRRGTIRVFAARIGGQLECSGASLHNPGGPALGAARLQTDGDVFLHMGFTAEGAGESGTIRLLNAQIGGSLHCSGATLKNPTGLALGAEGLHTDGDVYLDQGFTADGAGPEGTVRLTNAHISGELDCRRSSVTSRSGLCHRWHVEGLTYAGVPRLDPNRDSRKPWLELLRNATPAYAAQPYQQLAAAFRAEGHDSDVRTILMAQRHDQLERGALTRRVDRSWARLTGVLLGYGYQPWRALLCLLGVLTVSVILALILGGHGALARAPDTSSATQASEQCTVVQTIGKGLDLATPLLPAPRAARGSCEPTTSATGEALTISRWVLQLGAWALGALFIAGFTGIVRRT